MSEETAALRAEGLGKRYRRGWALQDCTFELPTGRVAALVGPNGAGKSTLMALVAGLIEPTAGQVRVLGDAPGRTGAHPKLAFLAQDKPLYRGFTVTNMLRAGRALNPGWDDAYAHRLIDEANVPLRAKVGTLSGGQRTRVALAVALARRPELLMLDEPLADLDPLARQEVLQTLMAEVAESGTTVLLSSHVIADLDGICDHLLLLADGRVHLAGDVDDLLAEHRLMIGPAGDTPFADQSVVHTRATERQSTSLVRGTATTETAGWQSHEPSLEELVLGYLRAAVTVPAIASAGEPADRADRMDVAA
jgi:ABC-2 type transport system ATP-binding protein